MESMHELARIFAAQFQQVTREDGSKPWVLKDGAREEYPELESLIYDVHDAIGESMPADYTYEFILDSLQAIAESDMLDNAPYQMAGLHYYGDLLRWLSDGNQTWVDEYINDFGTSAAKEGIMELIQKGAAYHQEKVCESVVEKLSDTYYAYFCDDE
jgi:hypothetical protein